MVSSIDSSFLCLDGLKSIYMKVTHRMNDDTFKKIIAIACGSSKRGGKKKKKKSKAGKVKDYKCIWLCIYILTFKAVSLLFNKFEMCMLSYRLTVTYP